MEGILVVSAAIYFIPTIVASSRRKRNTLAIGMLNLLLGWTLVGWVVAMVWACTTDDVNKQTASAEPARGSRLSNGAKVGITILAGLIIVGYLGTLDDDDEKTSSDKAVAENLSNPLPGNSLPDEVESSDETRDPPRPVSPWAIDTDVSPIDDSKTVYLRTHSTNPIDGRFGRSDNATLLIRCMENTTTLMLSFAGQYMADIRSYGQVTYRVDDADARTVNMNESTDNKWLGLWSGGSSIPVIKRLFGGDQLVVRATPFNESSITATFDISGIADEIKPLREACHW